MLNCDHEPQSNGSFSFNIHVENTLERPLVVNTSQSIYFYSISHIILFTLHLFIDNIENS